LESLIDLIYSPGVINIDFADLKAILKDKGNLAFLNTAEASGKDRLQEITDNILNNPLYKSNNFKAERILFNIQGGSGLGMFEVDQISKTIAEQNPKAKIIFGISKNQKYKNKIKTTLLMTGPPLVQEHPLEKKVMPLPKTEKLAVKKSQKPLKVKKKKTKKAVLAYGKDAVKIPVKKELTPALNVSYSYGVPGTLKQKLVSIGQPNIDKVASRRTALEIKEAEDLEEIKKSKQEEEWEIPAFLRIKK
jgi:cell division protein FtsZ